MKLMVTNIRACNKENTIIINRFTVDKAWFFFTIKGDKCPPKGGGIHTKSFFCDALFFQMTLLMKIETKQFKTSIQRLNDRLNKQTSNCL
jgi:hypothetical protein